MSYHRKRTTVLQPAPLGDVQSVVQTAADVLNDPYLSEAICHVQQLAAIENKRPVPTCTVTAPNLAGGVGIRKAMPAMRAYVYAEQHPWVKVAAVAGVLGVPMLVGYLLGRD